MIAFSMGRKRAGSRRRRTRVCLDSAGQYNIALQLTILVMQDMRIRRDASGLGYSLPGIGRTTGVIPTLANTGNYLNFRRKSTRSTDVLHDVQKLYDTACTLAVFTARRYASAVYTMALCLVVYRPMSQVAVLS